MTDKKVLALLRSGNFTLLYHDNGSCTLYKGKHVYEDATEDDECENFDTNQHEGYLPREVMLLVSALGGKCDSI